MQFSITPVNDESQTTGVPLYELRHHLDGEKSQSNRRGPFETFQEAKDHASTMAQAWGYSQSPSPSEHPEIPFLSDQVLLSR